MTNSELHELLKRELALPSEIQKKKHPTIKSSKAEFVDYAKDGKFTLAYPLRPDQRNGSHLLQGGYISVFFDDNFGLFAYVASEGHSFPTISFTVNFHKAVLEDTDKLLITTWVTSAGKRILFMSGEAKNTSGHLVASCQTNMLNAAGVRISV